jgi:hypothetical protein
MIPFLRPPEPWQAEPRQVRAAILRWCAFLLSAALTGVAVGLFIGGCSIAVRILQHVP